MEKNSKTLHNIFYHESLKSSLVPILGIEILLIILYFFVNHYNLEKNQILLKQDAEQNLEKILELETQKIEIKLKNIEDYGYILQNRHQDFFAHLNEKNCSQKINNYKFTKNSVFYKYKNTGMSSLYYANTTKIGKKELQKALCTESFDLLFKSIVDTNPIVTQAYINTYDNMNRIYPFIPEIYEQYGESITMEDFNFYYEADQKHNPDKKPVWTDVYLDPAGQGMMTSLIVPIYNNNFLEGVTGLDITIDSFVKNILNLKLPWNSFNFMLDKNSDILAMQPELKLVLKKSFDNNISQAIEFIKNNQNITINNTEYILFHKKISNTNWTLVSMLDEKSIFESAIEIKLFNDKMGYIAISVMILFYLLFFVLLVIRIKKISLKVTQPILKLAEETSNVGFQKASRLTCVGIKEIDNLNYNFNQMNNKLKEQTSQLVNAKLREEVKIKEIKILKRISKYLSPQIYKSIFENYENQEIKTKRKKLTIFFSDIINFTETTENTQPEEMTKFLNRYLTEMSNIALKYGATIDKFIGDAILVFFGDPETKGAKEDAITCVKMAIEMQSRTKELKIEFSDEGFARPFSSRMGIATGYTTVGNFGSENKMEYTILGSTVNLASRLESNAKANKILISEETYQLIKNEFECVKKEPIQAKGFHTYIQTYEVIKELSEKDYLIIDNFKGFNLDIELKKLIDSKDKDKAVESLKSAIDKIISS